MGDRSEDLAARLATDEVLRGALARARTAQEAARLLRAAGFEASAADIVAVGDDELSDAELAVAPGGTDAFSLRNMCWGTCSATLRRFNGHCV